MLSYLLFLFLFSSNLFAEWSFSPIIAYRSNGTYRGALYWPVPSIMPGIGISYNNTIFFKGPMIEVQKEWNGLTMRAGSDMFNDNKPLIGLKHHSEDFRNERQATYGIYTGIKYGPNPRAYGEITIFQDINEHKGTYILESITIPLIPFVSASVDYGLGTRSANRYAYGDGAVGGSAHLDYSFRARLPFLPFNGSILTSWKKSEILKGTNQSAYYIRGDKTNEVFSLMGMWRF